MGRALHGHVIAFSMIIHKIEIVGFAFSEAKDHPPVPPDGKPPRAREIAFQPMQSPTWEPSNVLDGVRSIDGSEHVAQLVDKGCWYRARIIVLKKPLQPLVAKTLNRHDNITVNRQVTDVNLPASGVGASNIQFVGLGELGALLDEGEAGLRLVAHELLAELARGVALLVEEFDAKQRAHRPVHGR